MHSDRVRGVPRPARPAGRTLSGRARRWRPGWGGVGDQAPVSPASGPRPPVKRLGERSWQLADQRRVPTQVSGSTSAGWHHGLHAGRLCTNACKAAARLRRTSGFLGTVLGDHTPHTRGGQGHRQHRRAVLDPFRYPNAIYDEDEQRWVSDAEVAEVGFTAFHRPPPVRAGHRSVDRAPVRRFSTRPPHRREGGPSPAPQTRSQKFWKTSSPLAGTRTCIRSR